MSPKVRLGSVKRPASGAAPGVAGQGVWGVCRQRRWPPNMSLELIGNGRNINQLADLNCLFALVAALKAAVFNHAFNENIQRLVGFVIQVDDVAGLEL